MPVNLANATSIRYSDLQCDRMRRDIAMPSGWSQKILTEVAMPGAIAQVVESRYDPGGTVSQQEADIMLRWRLWPYSVGIHSWQDGSRPVAVGRMIVMPAETEAGAIALDEAVTSSVSLRIDKDWLKERTGSSGAWKVEEPECCVDFRDPSVEYAMRRIASEVTTPGLCSGLIMESCLATIVADLCRHFENAAEPAYGNQTFSEKRVRRVEEFVINYTGGTPTLNEISAELGMDTAYMRQVFKKSTGKSLYKFVEEVRTSKAQKLLQDSSIPLKIISHELGFRSPSAFSHAFRKATGITPREFRIQFCQ